MRIEEEKEGMGFVVVLRRSERRAKSLKKVVLRGGEDEGESSRAKSNSGLQFFCNDEN